MKIEDLIERKKELGYTNKMLSEMSGVPIGTVNKIFSGNIGRPRFNTLQSLQCVLFPEMHSAKEAALNKRIVENLMLDYADRVSENSALSEYNAEIPKEEREHSYERLIAWKEQGEFTVDDWIHLPDGSMMELINGVLYDRNTPTMKHQFISGEICLELTMGIRSSSKDHEDCLVLAAPTSVQPDKDDDKNGFIPDVLIVCDREKYEGGEIIIGAPDFVAEILSPTTAKYDTNKKFNKYWQAGVREYWIIDLIEEEVQVYQFEKGVPPVIYSLEDRIPLGISEGEIIVDFKRISDRMKRYFSI